jgi:hypothetical protein
MAHPPPDADTGSDHESAADTPRWVIVFGVIALIVVLLFVILLLIGGGHSPRRHTSSGDAGGWHMATGLVAPGVDQP